MPTITNTSSFTVTVRASKAGYKTQSTTQTVKVNKANGSLSLSSYSLSLIHILKACKAGADIIMIGAPHNTVIHAIHKIEKNVKNKKIDINQIDKSVEKIIKLKEKYNITDELAKGCNIEMINKKIEEINTQL